MIKNTSKLNFSHPLVLVGASKGDFSKLASLPSDWPLIAADGGVDTLLGLKLLPQYVIGDMDSVKSLKNLSDKIICIRCTNQDNTDFEKCLNLVDAPLIIGFGFLEERFDHSIAALHALSCLRKDFPVLLVGKTDIIVRIKGDFSFSLPIGERISIIALARQYFCKSSGLKFPLDGKSLELGRDISISNQVSKDIISIKTGKGTGYAIITGIKNFDRVLSCLRGEFT